MAVVHDQASIKIEEIRRIANMRVSSEKEKKDVQVNQKFFTLLDGIERNVNRMLYKLKYYVDIGPVTKEICDVTQEDILQSKDDVSNESTPLTTPKRADSGKEATGDAAKKQSTKQTEHSEEVQNKDTYVGEQSEKVQSDTHGNDETEIGVDNVIKSVLQSLDPKQFEKPQVCWH